MRFEWLLEVRKGPKTVTVGRIDVFRNRPFSPRYSVHRIWPSLSDGTKPRSTDQQLDEGTTFEEACDVLFAHFKETIALWEPTLL